ncbi:hypothetical protein PHYPSEUDO_007671 [Phytophthora pseudosyringae]|uniref:WRKY19-like zinc finger domain-containing protein n=1 Tax=Phytophthora pseudosyringae TaxID=221518 RepID=A0A8T1VIZ5_9STRA|nr:hypothetical protein PHYPSEUDO_007671 [Phytophthora pseudosyringae]
MAGQGGGRGRGRGVGGERCSTAGCSNKAQASGRCRTHTGALGQCSQPGCEKQAQYRGLCVAHGGRRVCSRAGCSKTVTSRGLCGDHGGGRRRHSGSRRPSVKQETAASSVGPASGAAGGSMMSLLLNEWPQDVAAIGADSTEEQEHVVATPVWTAQSQDGVEFASPLARQTWTVSDAKFSSVVSPADATASVALPQETGQSLQVWAGGEHSFKLEPLVPAAASTRSGGSMMSLLLGGWSQDSTIDAVKTEEGSAERDVEGSPDSEVSAEKGARVRRRALCSYDGCTKIAQSQGRCVTHGGKRCTHPGCTKSAQYQGLCTTHGGSRTCTYPGCAKTIRSAGRCFEHGGGKQCSRSDCTKQAQSNGLCSTHRKS